MSIYLKSHMQVERRGRPEGRVRFYTNKIIVGNRKSSSFFVCFLLSISSACMTCKYKEYTCLRVHCAVFLSIQPFFRLTSSTYLDASAGPHHSCNKIFGKQVMQEQCITHCPQFFSCWHVSALHCTGAGVTKLCFISTHVSTEQLSKLKYCNSTWRTGFSRGSSALRTKEVFISFYCFIFSLEWRKTLFLNITWGGQQLLLQVKLCAFSKQWIKCGAVKLWCIFLFQYYTFMSNNELSA